MFDTKEDRSYDTENLFTVHCVLDSSLFQDPNQSCTCVGIALYLVVASEVQPSNTDRKALFIPNPRTTTTTVYCNFQQDVLIQSASQADYRILRVTFSSFRGCLEHKLHSRPRMRAQL